MEKRTVLFTKTYLTPSKIYTEPVEYSGKTNLSGTKITGKWYIGETSGTFTLSRDKGQIPIARQRRAANDLQSA